MLAWSFVCLVCLFVWLVGCLFGTLVVWFVLCVGRLVGWSVVRVVGWLVGRLVVCLAVRLVG